MNKGIFVLSLDLELAYGSIDKSELVFSERIQLFERTREVIDPLIALLEKYDISVTWATVGHLFLEACEQHSDVKHPEIVRSDYPWVKGDWFHRDPMSNINDDPIWYGADIIDKLNNAKVYQEIGSHSFSHQIFDERYMTKETAVSEIDACIQVAKAKGNSLESFVFPRNTVGHVDVLAEKGFKCYRGEGKLWYKQLPSKLEKIGHILDQSLAMTPKTYVPQVEKGIMNIPGSMMLLARNGFRKYIPIQSRITKAKKGINRAIKEQEVFHLWFHPFNLVDDTEQLLGALEKIFIYVNKQKNAGKIDVKTMGQIAKDYR